VSVSMSDCVDCWSTPCVCGSAYGRMEARTFREIFDAVTRVAPAIFAIPCRRCGCTVMRHNRDNGCGYRGCDEHTDCPCHINAQGTPGLPNPDCP
jgi:hypothetical protein